MARRMLLTVTVAIVAVLAAAQPNGSGNNGKYRAASPVASARLMKELVELYKSDIYKSGMIQMELVEDNLYEWQVKMFIVDPENPLHEDLQRWKAEGRGEDHILMRVSFGADFPSSPPFVRVVQPVLEGKYSFRGGSICMHLLSRQGWIPECTFESLILAILNVMTEGATGIRFGDLREGFGDNYSEWRARQEFESSMEFHGWDKPDANAGDT